MISYLRNIIYLIVLTITFSAHSGAYEDFLSAIRRDDASSVQSLLLRGLDPNTPNEAGISAVHWALQEESFKAAAALIQAPGLAFDKENEHGETPLMMAALKGQKALVQLLLDRGARAHKAGWAPLHYAASGPDAEVVAVLLSSNASTQARSPNATTPLMMAAGYGLEASVDLLLAAKADPTAKNDLGLTAADFAQRAGRDALAKRLAQAASR